MSIHDDIINELNMGLAHIVNAVDGNPCEDEIRCLANTMLQRMELVLSNNGVY